MRNKSLVSLFAGIGGFEIAAKAAGIHPRLLCENDISAQAVLRARFPQSQLVDDVRCLNALPRDTWMVTAGFPCQDLSSVGQKDGISGDRSSLIGDVFRLLEKHDPEWLVLENVMFMLHLGKGAAMEYVLRGLEDLGFNWAYRLLNTADFGLPQRRRRVYFVASRKHDAATAMFFERRRPPRRPCAAVRGRRSYGFYWTEGTYATGITENGIPPLKNGSTIGIPSPPAIVLASGTVGTPSIGDAERLQGFRKGWTLPATNVGRASLRWKLVGNAVSVPVAHNVIRRTVRATGLAAKDFSCATPFSGTMRTWPDAAFGRRGKRFAMPNDPLSGMKTHMPIHHFLTDEIIPLSAKATAGFLSRADKGSLNFPDGFLDHVRRHAAMMVSASC